MQPSTVASAGFALRPYQTDLLERWDRSKSRRALVVLPTGGGKTNVAVAAIAKVVADGGVAIVVAHRRELIQQVRERLEAAGLNMASLGIADPTSPVQLWGPVGLRNHLRTKKIKNVRLVVIDEAHRSVAGSYTEIIKAFPRARIMGLTATPVRLDNRGLGDVYEEIIEGPDAEALIGQGYLSRARIFVPDVFPDVKNVKRSGGDFNRESLAKVVSRRTLVGNIVKEWKKHCEGMKTIAFAVNVRHANIIARKFRAAGIAAAAVSSETSKEKRDELVDRFRRGDLMVLVNCDLFVEGFDVPEARCAILARPTKSLTVHLQQCGRVLRPGPITPIILNHSDNVRTLGTPWTQRQWSLTKTFKIKHGEAFVRRCDCGAEVAASTVVCSECGRTLREPLSAVTSTRGSLVEYVEEANSNGISYGVFMDRVRKGMPPDEAAKAPVGTKYEDWHATARKNGVLLKTFHARISNGWSARKAATTPTHDHGSFKRRWEKLATDNGIKWSTFYNRVKKGWSPRRAAAEPVYGWNSVRRGSAARWLKVAARNGIKPATFKDRLRSGMSPKEAASPKSESEYQKWVKVAKSNGIGKNTFGSRLLSGMSHKEAATKPLDRRRASPDPFIAIAKSNGIAYGTYRARLKSGWTKEEASSRPLLDARKNLLKGSAAAAAAMRARKK